MSCFVSLRAFSLGANVWYNFYEVTNMIKVIALAAFYLNPILSIWFFINFVTIIRKIVNGEVYTSKLWIGSILLAWFVYSYTVLLIA